jgi:hypothetical protein
MTVPGDAEVIDTTTLSEEDVIDLIVAKASDKATETISTNGRE